jgi:hypothetical protein
VDELIAIVGGSWQPLLLYPGVLTALLGTALMHAIWRFRASRAAGDAVDLQPTPTRALVIASMLLCMACLPVPRSYWAYPIDLAVALLLLEAPHWLRLARLARSTEPAIRDATAYEIGTLLNAYLLLMLAAAALGQAAGSLLLPDLKRGTPLLHWLGIVTWGIALPPLIGLGPWYLPATDGWLPDLRRVAHIALLVALALPAGDQWGHTASAFGAAAGFGSLTALHFAWRGRPEPWERAQPLVALVALAILLVTNMQAWLAKLQ